MLDSIHQAFIIYSLYFYSVVHYADATALLHAVWYVLHINELSPLAHFRPQESIGALPLTCPVTQS